MTKDKNILKGMWTILVVCILGACQDAIETEKTTPEGPVREICAILPGEDEIQTKTSMGDLQNGKYPVWWEKEDQIGISTGSSVSKYSLKSGAGTKIGSFTGTGSGQIAGSNFYAACYPYKNGQKMALENGEIVVGSILSNQQTYRENSFDTNTYPMAAVSDKDNNFEFRNLAGVLQLNIKGSGTIKQIILTGNDSETIAGGIAMHYEQGSGEPIAEATDWSTYKISTYEPKGMITLNLGKKGIQLKDTQATTFNIAVIPQTFTKGFTLRIIAENGGTFEKSTTNPIIIKRSYTRIMQDFDYTTPEPLETANAYIISEAGYYTIPAFCMGNRQGVLLDTKGRDLAAAVLWTDVSMQSVIDVEYTPSENGKGNISFKLNKNPETGEPYRGNTVVCLYDKKTKEILWSWHLWLTEEPETVYTGGYCADGSYTTGTGENRYTFVAEAASNGRLAVMDRNLGAISARPEDGWLTYGLYYQMGRKDPFIGGNYNGNTVRSPLTTISNETINSVRLWENNPFAEGTHWTDHDQELTSGWEYKADYINLTTSIRHPMTFSVHPVNRLWTDCNASDNMNYMDQIGKLPGSGLTSSGHEAYWNRTKTIFDPCPAGWTVLGERGGLYFGKNDQMQFITNDATGLGMRVTHQGASSSWWPAAGFRSVLGRMGDIGYTGAYFHFDHIEATHGGHGTVFSLSGSNRLTGSDIKTNHATPIRCVRAKQGNN